MIVEIKQREWAKGDCGVACVAMVTEKSYKTVKAEFFERNLIDNDGNYHTFHKDLIGLLEGFGFSAKRKMFKSWKEVKTPAIVKINLRKGNYWHWVVLIERNGKKIMFDPNPKAPEGITSFRGKKGSGQYLFIEKC